MPHGGLDERWQVEGALGLRLGSLTVDGAATGTDVAAYVSAGVRRHRLLLGVEYELMAVTYPLPVVGDTEARGAVLGIGNGDGLMQRLGANARWQVARGNDDSDGMLANVYVEGGVGVERYAWDTGGVWWRPDLAFGLGTELFGFTQHMHAGMTLGLRVTLAPRNDLAGAPAVCGGPCSYATPPPGWDRSFMFDMSVPFGRPR